MIKWRVLVVDDEAERVDKYQHVFRSSDFECVFAVTSDELTRRSKDPFDLYVIDVFLRHGDWKDSDAADVCARLDECAPRSAPIVLVSKYWSDREVLDVLGRMRKWTDRIVQYIAYGEIAHVVSAVGEESQTLTALRQKIVDSVAIWHGRSRIAIGEDEPLRILMLADLQYGDPDESMGAGIVEQWIVAQLRQNGRVPDLVAILGDVAYSGRDDEYLLAAERLRGTLFAGLWGPHYADICEDRIVVVSGNHDCNLRMSYCDRIACVPASASCAVKDEERPPMRVGGVLQPAPHARYAGEPFRRFATTVTNDRQWRATASHAWIDRRFVGLGVQFVLFNSSWEMSFDQVRKASFGVDNLNRIGRELGAAGQEDLFTVALSHHGLPHDSAGPMEIAMADWKGVGREFFAVHKIGLWAFGHYHRLQVSSKNDDLFRRPLWLVQAPTLRIGHGARGFCVLEFGRRGGRVVSASVYPYELSSDGIRELEARLLFADE
jgi:CheY-like chemotaxis protein